MFSTTEKSSKKILWSFLEQESQYSESESSLQNKAFPRNLGVAPESTLCSTSFHLFDRALLLLGAL
jgi:hypothetical protein